MKQDLYVNKPDAPMQPDIFKKKVYQEVFWDWNPVCKKNTAHICQFSTGNETSLIKVLPDGCRCFVFECSDNPSGRVHGLRRQNAVFTLKPNSEYFAFKPYTTQGIRKGSVGWHELVDEYLDFELLFPHTDMVSRMNEAGSFEKRVSLWMEFAIRYLIDSKYNCKLVEHSEHIICQSKGSIKIDTLSETLGYTGRHCREKFKNAHGISIKNYSEIIRFQNSVRLLGQKQIDALDVTYSNNYYDQSHFIKEFKKFADYTPNNFKKQFYEE